MPSSDIRVTMLEVEMEGLRRAAGTQKSAFLTALLDLRVMIEGDEQQEALEYIDEWIGARDA